MKNREVRRGAAAERARSSALAETAHVVNGGETFGPAAEKRRKDGQDSGHNQNMTGGGALMHLREYSRHSFILSAAIKASTDPDKEEEACRSLLQPLQLLILTFSPPYPLARSLPALCDVRLCPLGATISPSNSFQPGIRRSPASPTPPKPALLRRDRQLVRLGEVAFDVPGFAEASLFARIKAGEI